MSRKSRIQDGGLNDGPRATPRRINNLLYVSVPTVEKGIQTLIREDMSPNGVTTAVLILRTQLVSLLPTLKATIPVQLVNL
jgi:hypothetical protein